MATYNGELYVGEQITSILNQTYSNFRLIISDDGSCDNTIRIIEKYKSIDSRVTIYNNKYKHGIVGNFNNALSKSTSNYIMFCDQDDFWVKNKIAILIDKIIEHENSDKSISPCLLFTNLEIVDKNLNKISKNFYYYNGLNPEFNYKKEYLLWKSTVYGCTTIFNRELYKVAGFVKENCVLHDHWFALHAVIFGKIKFIDLPLVKYRQHQFNQIGSKERGLLNKLKRSFKTLQRIKQSVKNTKNTLFYMKENRYFYGKNIFIKECIVPFFKERTLYLIIFIILIEIYG